MKLPTSMAHSRSFLWWRQVKWVNTIRNQSGMTGGLAAPNLNIWRHTLRRVNNARNQPYWMFASLQKYTFDLKFISHRDLQSIHTYKYTYMYYILWNNTACCTRHYAHLCCLQTGEHASLHNITLEPIKTISFDSVSFLQLCSATVKTVFNLST